MISEVHNIDCMEYMLTIPYKFFELAIVDPPYGIWLSHNPVRQKHSKKDWDINIPTDEYFEELQRVSVNQIIWGGNYFPLPPTQCFIFWYKGNPVQNFADGELAWTSFKKVAKCFDYRYYGNLEGANSATEKIHPTQKPVALYKWLLQNYAKKGDKILDTHMGSQSSRIAAYDMGFDYYGCELDKEYFEAGNKRFELFKQQQKLF